MKLTIPDVLPAIRAYYAKPGNYTGGHLHIVLEDSNVEDGNVIFCLNSAAEGTPHQEADPDAVRLAAALLLMSKTQRRKLAAMMHYPD